MKRLKIVAGNWKMNGSKAANKELMAGLFAELPPLADNVRVIVAPPAVYLQQVARKLKKADSPIQLAAQNCHTEVEGAYTGEVSATMLRDLGCEWVILGHSERRQYQSEDAALLLSKTRAALAAGLQVIFCCGEPLEVRDAGTENSYVEQQLRDSVLELDRADWKRVVLAYEPIWAIGTGRTATAEQAGEMHRHIRGVVASVYGEEVAEATSILYGGSAKPGNAAELFGKPDVDGGLIGGAALKAEDFLGIIKAI